MFAATSQITNLAESEQLSWDVAKQIIQSQHSLAIYGITVVVAVAAGLMFASWIWNLVLRRHELERATESLKSEITTKAGENFLKFTQTIKDEIGGIRKEIEKSVEKRMVLFDAEKARLFALAGYQFKNYQGMAMWFTQAIEGYSKAGEEALLRACVDGLNVNLAACKKLSESAKQTIKKCLPFIPDILRKEKEQIEDKLKKLPTEITEQPETK